MHVITRISLAKHLDCVLNTMQDYGDGWSANINCVVCNSYGYYFSQNESISVAHAVDIINNSACITTPAPEEPTPLTSPQHRPLYMTDKEYQRFKETV